MTVVTTLRTAPASAGAPSRPAISFGRSWNDVVRACPDLARDTRRPPRRKRAARPSGLVLRPWRPGDARAVAAAYADPAIQRWHMRRVDSEDEARDLILRWQRSWPAETGAHWAVTHDGGGEVIGRVALRSITLEAGWAECAYE